MTKDMCEEERQPLISWEKFTFPVPKKQGIKKDYSLSHFMASEPHNKTY